MKGITDRQARFVEHYLECGNASEACRRAGYSERNVSKAANRLLHHMPKVRAALDSAIAAREKRTQINADRVVRELASIGFANLSRFLRLDGSNAWIDFSDATEEDLAVVQEIVQDEYIDGTGDDGRTVKRTRIKLHSKISALQELMKHVTLEAGKPTERVENVGGDVDSMSPDELTAAYRRLISGTDGKPH